MTDHLNTSPSSLRIVFMGTAPFAVPSLSALLNNGMRVVAVVTAPDKPKGRGQRKAYSPIKQHALACGLPVLQPVNLKSADFLKSLKNCRADLQVVVAFRMLPKVVWGMPALGTINLHASLLPQYRGAAPIHWAIINGEQKTGVTTFFINHKIDTGKIILQEEAPIHATDDFGTLHDRLMKKGAQLVCETVTAIATGQYVTKEQYVSPKTKTAPKLFKNTCRISWNGRVGEIINFVRGLSPYPAAWTRIGHQQVKIFKLSATDGACNSHEKPVGALLTDNKNYLKFRAADGWIAVEEWQPEGKRRMDVATFFRGNKLSL